MILTLIIRQTTNPKQKTTYFIKNTNNPEVVHPQPLRCFKDTVHVLDDTETPGEQVCSICGCTKKTELINTGQGWAYESITWVSNHVVDRIEVQEFTVENERYHSHIDDTWDSWRTELLHPFVADCADPIEVEAAITNAIRDEDVKSPYVRVSIYYTTGEIVSWDFSI